MAQVNDVIDLTSAGTGVADNFVVSGEVVDKELQLSMINYDIVRIDLEEVTTEFAGNLWNQLHEYLVGDIVSYENIAYIATQISTGSIPPNNTGLWILADNMPWNGSGALWNVERTYNIGDMVTDTISPANAFIALQNSIGQPLPIGGGTNQYWEELAVPYHNATTGGQDAAAGLTFNGKGIHIPDPSINLNGTSGTGILEYPNTSGEINDSVWYISGLGDTNGIPNEYIVTEGGLAGAVLRDQDKISWIDGLTSGTPGDGSEVWLHTQFPRVNGEKGGIQWFGNRQYEKGDIVTNNSVIYIADQDNIGETPVGQPTIWRSLAAGLYDITLEYNEGQMINYDGNIYIAPAGGVPAGTTPPNAPWILAFDDMYVKLSGDTMSGSLSMDGNKITNVGTATTGTDALNRITADERYINIYGDAMQGTLAMSGHLIIDVANAQSDTDALNRTYADSRYINVFGGDTMHGSLSMSGHLITNVANAVNNADVLTTNSYASSTLGGSVKMSVVDGVLYITNNGSNTP